MKALFVLAMVSFISTGLFAQRDFPNKKGNLLLGGSLSIDKNNYTKTDPNVQPASTYLHAKILSINSDLSLNYMLNDHFSVGIVFNGLFSSSKESYFGNSYIEVINNDFFFGPVIRYYILPGFYINSSAEFGTTNNFLKQEPVKYKQFLFSGGVGYTICLNKKVGIEPALRYYYQSSTGKEVYDITEKHNGLQFSLGIQIFFNLKR
jgi:hypothetical protein